MGKELFAQTVIGKLRERIGDDGSAFSVGTASVAMSAVADAVTEYLTEHVRVSVSYRGMTLSLPPVQDIVPNEEFRIEGQCAPPSPSNSFDSWIREIEMCIIAGFQLKSPSAGGVTFVKFPFKSVGNTVNQGMLKAVHDVRDESPQQKVWEVVCEGIMNWITNLQHADVTSSFAAHSAPLSVGVAQIIGITID